MRQADQLIKTLALAAGAWIFAASSAFAANVGGYRFDETARVGNQDLKLNGTGVRYKAVFSVYSAGLYPDAKKATPAEIYAAPGAKRIRLVMHRR